MWERGTRGGQGARLERGDLSTVSGADVVVNELGPPHSEFRSQGTPQTPVILITYGGQQAGISDGPSSSNNAHPFFGKRRGSLLSSAGSEEGGKDTVVQQEPMLSEDEDFESIGTAAPFLGGRAVGGGTSPMGGGGVPPPQPRGSPTPTATTPGGTTMVPSSAMTPAAGSSRGAAEKDPRSSAGKLAILVDDLEEHVVQLELARFIEKQNYHVQIEVGTTNSWSVLVDSISSPSSNI